MANSFRFYVGGTGARTAATEYTSQLVRGSYTKNFSGEYDFSAYIDGVTKSAQGDDFKRDQNVFFCIYTGSTHYLLLKGVIKDVSWASQYRCGISGVQCKRGASGGKGGLENLKAPQLTNLGEISLDDLISDTTWFSGASVFKDNATSGEGKNLRAN